MTRQQEPHFGAPRGERGEPMHRSTVIHAPRPQRGGLGPLLVVLLLLAVTGGSAYFAYSQYEDRARLETELAAARKDTRLENMAAQDKVAEMKRLEKQLNVTEEARRKAQSGLNKLTKAHAKLQRDTKARIAKLERSLADANAKASAAAAAAKKANRERDAAIAATAAVERRLAEAAQADAAGDARIAELQEALATAKQDAEAKAAVAARLEDERKAAEAARAAAERKAQEAAAAAAKSAKARAAETATAAPAPTPKPAARIAGPAVGGRPAASTSDFDSVLKTVEELKQATGADQ